MRVARRVVTTADKMLAAGTLPHHLRVALDAFAVLVGNAHGAATLDGDDHTSRLTGAYEPMTRAAFGSKTPSDRQLAGLGAYREMSARVPAEMRLTFEQIIGEETGDLRGPRRTLTEIGESYSFKHKQASSAGAMQIICILMIVHEFMRHRDIEYRK